MVFSPWTSLQYGRAPLRSSCKPGKGRKDHKFGRDGSTNGRECTFMSFSSIFKTLAWGFRRGLGGLEPPVHFLEFKELHNVEATYTLCDPAVGFVAVAVLGEYTRPSERIAQIWSGNIHDPLTKSESAPYARDLNQCLRDIHTNDFPHMWGESERDGPRGEFYDSVGWLWVRCRYETGDARWVHYFWGQMSAEVCGGQWYEGFSLEGAVAKFAPCFVNSAWISDWWAVDIASEFAGLALCAAIAVE